jgi:hypothetical protein
MDYWYESIDQDSAVEKTADEKQLLEEKLWRQIQAKTQPHQPELIQPTPNWWQRNRYRLTAAASIVLIAGFIYTVSTFTQSRPIAFKRANYSAKLMR